MAGSIKTFQYEDNNGNFWAVNMDESNGEAVGNTDFTDASTAEFFLPRNVEARYANYRSADGLYNRTIIVTDPNATTSSLPSQISVADGNGGTVDVLLTQLTGEVVKVIPKATDTAQTDGDAT